MTSGEAVASSCSLIAGQSQEAAPLLVHHHHHPVCAGEYSCSPIETAAISDSETAAICETASSLISIESTISGDQLSSLQAGLSSESGRLQELPESPSASPLLSQLGPVSPAEELTPAVIQESATSSLSRSATLSSISHSPLNTSTLTAPSTTAKEQSSVLVLDWSRPRTASAIFKSSSGVGKVHIQARPLYARQQARIERLKWRDPNLLLARSSSHSVASVHNHPTSSGASSVALPESPKRPAIPSDPIIDVDSLSQITLVNLPVNSPSIPLVTP